MRKPVALQPLLQLLVRVYNQSIQTYHHFPDVILCGRHRLEPDEFRQLLLEGYIVACATDSFGSVYRITQKAELLLQQHLAKRRHRLVADRRTVVQAALPFMGELACGDQ